VGNFRQRRQVCAWRGGGPARRRGAVLPALARARPRRGAEPPHLRVRHAGSGHHRAAAAAGVRRKAGPALARGGRLLTAHPFPPRRLEVAAVREDLPILGTRVHGRPLAYLDNAATTQKPRAVLEAMDRLYTTSYANIHRGLHSLSARATAAFE